MKEIRNNIRYKFLLKIEARAKTHAVKMTERHKMIKSLFVLWACMLSVMVYSSSLLSSESRNLSFGLGTDQGGLGWKFSFNDNRTRFYGSLGLHSYSEASGTNLGYGLGWERLVSAENNSIGIFIGAITSEARNDERTTYQGGAIIYNYYFNGFANKGFVIGSSVGYGVSSNDHAYFKDNKASSSLKLSYQW